MQSCNSWILVSSFIRKKDNSFIPWTKRDATRGDGKLIISRDEHGTSQKDQIVHIGIENTLEPHCCAPRQNHCARGIPLWMWLFHCRSPVVSNRSRRKLSKSRNGLVGRNPTTGCLLPALQPAFRQRTHRLGESCSSWLFWSARWNCISLAKDGLKTFFESLPQFAFWKLGKENSFKIDYLMTRSQTHEKNI